MGIKKSAITRWLMAVVIIWPFSCSMIQPAVKKNMPSPTPGSRTIEPIPESQPQQAFPQEGPSLSTPQVKHFTHEIKWRGETLGSVAGWYNG